MEARSRLESGTPGAIKAAKQVYELLLKKKLKIKAKILPVLISALFLPV